MKKQLADKPGSVSSRKKHLPFIYTRCHHQAQAVYPPAWDEQPSLTPVYMTLQLLRCTARYVTTRLVSSYLTFSPLLCSIHGKPGIKRSGCFLLHDSTITDSFLLGSRMLCVARTFLFYLCISGRLANCF